MVSFSFVDRSVVLFRSLLQKNEALNLLRVIRDTIEGLCQVWVPKRLAFPETQGVRMPEIVSHHCRAFLMSIVFFHRRVP